MSAEELVQENDNPDIGICEECTGEINCNKENIYILTKEEENDKLWCQFCFEELWKEYSNNCWTGDDIEYYLEKEKEEKEKEEKEKEEKEKEEKEKEEKEKEEKEKEERETP